MLSSGFFIFMFRLKSLNSFVLLFLCLFTLTVLGLDDANLTVGFESEIRNSNNKLVINQQIGMRISILHGALDGPVLYVETHNPTTDSSGLVNVFIGKGSVVSGSFQNINWSDDLNYLKIENDIDGNGFYIVSGINQLQNFPFVLSNKSDMVTVSKISSLENDAGYITTDLGNRNIINLAHPVQNQDAVTKAYVDALEARIKELELAILKPTDSEGNIYDIVKIGNQLWMAENLRTTHFNDGTSIPHVTSNTDWNNLTTPAYSWYNNDQSAYGGEYGALYNWYAVNTGMLCPVGWHIPTDTEWSVLTGFLGFSESDKLMENDTLKQKSISVNGADKNEFNIIPGGYRTYIGVFGHVDDNGMWWSSSEYSTNYAWYRSLNSTSNDIIRNFFLKKNGFYIRCIRD